MNSAGYKVVTLSSNLKKKKKKIMYKILVTKICFFFFNVLKTYLIKGDQASLVKIIITLALGRSSSYDTVLHLEK